MLPSEISTLGLLAGKSAFRVCKAVMKKLAVSILVLSMTAPAFASGKSKEKGLDAELRRLDPATRLEQICDIEAMRLIKNDPNSYRPDRAVLAATSDPKTAGHIIEGTGGAFRSKGKWYSFSFKCEASDDHMQVLGFDYKLGEAIPENQWAKDGLWQ
jgi:Domain of Unknown Function (DUF930)